MKRHTFLSGVPFLILCLVLLLVLVASVILATGMGPVAIPPDEVYRVVLYHLFGLGTLDDISVSSQNIVWFLRVPRVLLGMMAGILLSLSGVGMQAYTKNPLADPYVLGISSGASFGAVLAMLTPFLGFLGRFQTATGAFLGALISITLVYLLSKTGEERAPIRLILVGVAVTSLFGAFTNYLVYQAPDDAAIREVTFWMLGGLANVEWSYLLPAGLVLGPAVLVMLLMANPLNALLMGERTATSLGVNVPLCTKILIFTTALMTAVAVAVCGTIGFVGLVVPHVVRALVGSNHRRVVPLSILLGGIFMIWVDVAARMLDAPNEIPVGILTALLGAPFFLWLVKARKYSFGGG